MSLNNASMQEEEESKFTGPYLQILFEKSMASVKAVEDCVFLVFDQIDLVSIANELRPRMSVGQIMHNLDFDGSDNKINRKNTVSAFGVDHHEKLL
jgi:hypothetical protein